MKPGILLAAGALVGLSACGGSGTATTATPSGASQRAVVDVAVGASETVGAGIQDQNDRLVQAWPQLVFNDALPASATFYSLGVPGITTHRALTDELPAAVALRPTLVTVWLNVDDLAAGVGPAAYEQDLGTLVHRLRATGATVLVANVPVLHSLPAYRACRPGAPSGVRCLLGAGVVLADPATLDAAVDAYDAAITRVCAQEGALLVDLHAQGDIAVIHPDWVGTDGFHPSALGHRAVAASFEAVLRRAGF